MRISDWSSDVCSSDLRAVDGQVAHRRRQRCARTAIDRAAHRQRLRIGQREARRGEAVQRTDVVDAVEACRADRLAAQRGCGARAFSAFAVLTVNNGGATRGDTVWWFV